MEHFLPSEIARLVLGYLKEEGCEDAYRAFLAESPRLREYSSMLKRGRKFPTCINGQTLQDMLHMYGQLLSQGVVDNFKQASNNKDAGTDEQATQRNSSHVASCSGRQDQDPPKFDLSSDSDAVPSTPSDTEDSGVASGSRLGSFYRSGLRGREGIHRRWTGRDSSGSRSASFRGDGGRDTGTPQSRSPRHSSHNWRSPSRLSADHSSVSSISRPRGPVRTRGGKSCALPPAARKGMHSEEPWRNTSDHSNSVTPLNTHRTVPNRTTRERKLSDHEWDVDGVSSDHADESLDLSAVGSATPPMISVSVDNKDRLKLTVTTPVPPPSLRNLLTKPLAFTAASTPVRNSRASPLAKDTKFLSGQSPSRPSVTTTTAARGSVAPSVNQPVDVRRSPTISNTTADVDFSDTASSGFKTPQKRETTAPKSLPVGKSPKRKSLAPKRRSEGSEFVFVKPAAFACTGCRTSCATTTTVSTSYSKQACTTSSVTSCVTTSATAATAVPGTSSGNRASHDAATPSNPLLEELASNKDLAEKMAEVINKQVRFDLSKTDPSPQDEVTDGGNTGAESDQQIDVCLDTSLDEILNTVDSNMNTHEIVRQIEKDPAFDALFNMFNVDKHDFIEKEYGMVMSPHSGLVTPPLPVVTGESPCATTSHVSSSPSVASTTMSTDTHVHPIEIPASTDVSQSSALQSSCDFPPSTSPAHVENACSAAAQPAVSSGFPLQPTSQPPGLQAQPVLNQSQDISQQGSQALPVLNASSLLGHPGQQTLPVLSSLPLGSIAFIPLCEVKPLKKTNDPSKIKSSASRVAVGDNFSEDRLVANPACGTIERVVSITQPVSSQMQNSVGQPESSCVVEPTHSKSAVNQPVGSLTLISEEPLADDHPGLKSMPVLHIDDCDSRQENVQFHTASIIHPDSSGRSIETVRIVRCELPENYHQLVNVSACPEVQNVDFCDTTDNTEAPMSSPVSAAGKKCESLEDVNAGGSSCRTFLNTETHTSSVGGAFSEEQTCLRSGEQSASADVHKESLVIVSSEISPAKSNVQVTQSEDPLCWQLREARKKRGDTDLLFFPFSDNYTVKSVVRSRRGRAGSASTPTPGSRDSSCEAGGPSADGEGQTTGDRQNVAEEQAIAELGEEVNIDKSPGKGQAGESGSEKEVVDNNLDEDENKCEIGKSVEEVKHTARGHEEPVPLFPAESDYDDDCVIVKVEAADSDSEAETSVKSEPNSSPATEGVKTTSTAVQTTASPIFGPLSNMSEETETQISGPCTRSRTRARQRRTESRELSFESSVASECSKNEELVENTITEKKRRNQNQKSQVGCSERKGRRKTTPDTSKRKAKKDGKVAVKSDAVWSDDNTEGGATDPVAEKNVCKKGRNPHKLLKGDAKKQTLVCEKKKKNDKKDEKSSDITVTAEVHEHKKHHENQTEEPQETEMPDESADPQPQVVEENDSFQTPNEYNKAIGFDVDNPEQEQPDRSSPAYSRQNADDQEKGTQGKLTKNKKDTNGKNAKKAKTTNLGETGKTDSGKDVKRKRSKLKRETGPLCIAPKKADLAKETDAQRLKTATVLYAAPTPSPSASSFSSAGNTPKHVRMLDFNMAATPSPSGSAPGQSPPVSSLGAQVTVRGEYEVGFLSPAQIQHGPYPTYPQLATPSSSYFQPTAASHTQQVIDVGTQRMSMVVGSPSVVGQYSSEESIDTAAFHNVQSADILRTLAGSIGIPMEEGTCSGDDISKMTSTAEKNQSDRDTATGPPARRSSRQNLLHVYENQNDSESGVADSPGKTRHCVQVDDSGSLGDHEAAEALLQMANTPVKNYPADFSSYEEDSRGSNPCEQQLQANPVHPSTSGSDAHHGDGAFRTEARTERSAAMGSSVELNTEPMQEGTNQPRRQQKNPPQVPNVTSIAASNGASTGQVPGAFPTEVTANNTGSPVNLTVEPSANKDVSQDNSSSSSVSSCVLMPPPATPITPRRRRPNSSSRRAAGRNNRATGLSGEASHLNNKDDLNHSQNQNKQHRIMTGTASQDISRNPGDCASSSLNNVGSGSVETNHADGGVSAGSAVGTDSESGLGGSSVFSTPKKQLMCNVQHLSELKSPGVKSLLEATIQTQLSQSPRTSRRHSAIVDEILESCSPKENVLETPKKLEPEEHFVSFNPPAKSLFDTPSKSCDIFQAHYASQIAQEQLPEQSSKPVMEVNNSQDVKGDQDINGDAKKTKRGKSKKKSKGRESKSNSHSKEKSDDNKSKRKKKKRKSKGEEGDPRASGENKEEEGAKKKHRHKGKKGSHSRRKKTAKDSENSERSETSKKRKRSSSKRKESSKKKRERELVEQYMSHTPLGDRSPLVCGMSLPGWDEGLSVGSDGRVPSGSPAKISRDLAQLLSQVQQNQPDQQAHVPNTTPAQLSGHSVFVIQAQENQVQPETQVTSLQGEHQFAVASTAVESEVSRRKNPTTVPSDSSTATQLIKSEPKGLAQSQKRETSLKPSEVADQGTKVLAGQHNVPIVRQEEPEPVKPKEQATRPEEAFLDSDKAEKRNASSQIIENQCEDKSPQINNVEHDIKSVESKPDSEEGTPRSEAFAEKDLNFSQSGAERRPLAEMGGVSPAERRDSARRKGKKRSRDKDKEDTTPEKKRRKRDRSAAIKDMDETDICSFLDSAYS